MRNMKIDHVALHNCKVQYGLVNWNIEQAYHRALFVEIYSRLQSWGNGTKNDVYLLGVI